MKIIYVTDAFAVWGGMERVLADKMNFLVENKDYIVTLVTINQGDHPLSFNLHQNVCHADLKIRMHKQYKYHGIKRLIIRKELNQLLKERLKEVVNKINPDIIFCVKFDFVGVLLKVKGNARLIVESHTLCRAEYLDGSGWLRRMHIRQFKKNIAKADAVIALTRGDANEWLKITPNVYVIPNVVHLNELETFSRCNKKSVIYVGRFCHQKDISSLLRIWQMVHVKHPDWTLNMYSEGELRNEYLTKIESLDANIQVFDPTHNIMLDYLNNSILVLTSLYEPFGLVLPEAMSCGLPVVSFNSPYGPEEIITDGIDGYLIKGRNIEEFADKVCQLIEDDNLRHVMGRAAIQSAQRYAVAKIMPQWLHLLETMRRI